jgi:hypothetical protein
MVKAQAVKAKKKHVATSAREEWYREAGKIKTHHMTALLQF